VVEGIRQHPDAAYGIAIGLVALATLTRWAIGDYIGGNVPFITFFPAIIIGALLSGIWPGVCATILSVLAGWYLFLPPAFSFELEYREFVQLLLFVFFCLINLAAVAVVNAVMDRARAQEENARILLDGVPAGIVVVDAQGNIKLVNASTERLFATSSSNCWTETSRCWCRMDWPTCNKSSATRFCKSPRRGRSEYGGISELGAGMAANLRSRSASVRSATTAGAPYWQQSSTFPSASARSKASTLGRPRARRPRGRGESAGRSRGNYAQSSERLVRCRHFALFLALGKKGLVARCFL